MKAARRPERGELIEGFFSCRNARSRMPQSQREGTARFSQEMRQNHILPSLSFRCGYPLHIGLTRADAAKSGRTITTPPKTGGSCGPSSGALRHTVPAPPMRVAIVLIDPCGKARSSPQRGR